MGVGADCGRWADAFEGARAARVAERGDLILVEVLDFAVFGLDLPVAFAVDDGLLAIWWQDGVALDALLLV